MIISVFLVGSSSQAQDANNSKEGLIIKQVYYTGSKKLDNTTYFSDQFFEIYNNSNTIIYTDGLMIADVYGNSGQINANSLPTPFKDITDSVYLNSIWRIPGNGTQYPLAPGKSIIIAQDGIDHKNDPNGNPNSPCDLSKADWETYNQRSDNRDLDAPNVPNLDRFYFTGGFDWLLTVFGPSLVIFTVADTTELVDTPVPGSSFLAPRKRLHIKNVIDGFEALMNANSSGYKRIPAGVDAGFVFASGTYTSETAVRKNNGTLVGGVFQYDDTDNSTEDYEVKVLTGFTDIKEESSPSDFTLEQNFPNPFNPSTTINFSLANSGKVTLRVSNLLGEVISTLVDDVLPAGSHSVNFSASQLSSGVYLYSLMNGENVVTKQMVVLK